jgi:hypothetical protein
LRAAVGPVAADRVGEPDAGILQHVVGVAAWQVETGGLLSEQRLVARAAAAGRRARRRPGAVAISVPSWSAGARALVAAAIRRG